MQVLIYAFLTAFLLADLTAILLWRALAFPRSQLWMETIFRGASNQQKIAITFDDGPSEQVTPKVLDILRAEGVHATFFVCGQNVERNPQLVQRIAREGHTLGNHTYTHPYLYLHGRQRLADEIDRTQVAIEQACGSAPSYFRPPYGGRALALKNVLKHRQMKLVTWSNSGDDWAGNAEQIFHRATKDLGADSIVLLHDGRAPQSGFLSYLFTKERLLSKDNSAAMLDALPEIIREARARGLEPVSIEELLASKE